MATKVFHYNHKRLLRNLFFLIPLAAFLLILHQLHLANPIIYVFFGVIAAIWTIGSLAPAFRFRIILQEDGEHPEIDCRGRVTHRKIALSDITKLEIRKRREKSSRLFRMLPFRELVVHNSGKRLIISSLTLGHDAFDELYADLQKILPASIFADSENPA